MDKFAEALGYANGAISLAINGKRQQGDATMQAAIAAESAWLEEHRGAILAVGSLGDYCQRDAGSGRRERCAAAVRLAAGWRDLPLGRRPLAEVPDWMRALPQERAPGH